MGFSNKHNLLWSGERSLVAKTGATKLKSFSEKVRLWREKEMSGHGSFAFLPLPTREISTPPSWRSKNVTAPTTSKTKIIGIIILNFIKIFFPQKRNRELGFAPKIQ